jgi:hypothetical protein
MAKDKTLQQSLVVEQELSDEDLEIMKEVFGEQTEGIKEASLAELQKVVMAGFALVEYIGEVQIPFRLVKGVRAYPNINKGDLIIVSLVDAILLQKSGLYKQRDDLVLVADKK